MPGKKKATERNPWEVDFIRCELDKSSKELLHKWDVKGELTFDTISKLIDDGYKLTISKDSANDSVGAWLTSPKSPSGERQQCLGARGPDVFGAMRTIVFKHSIILEGDWGSIASNNGGDKQWG